MHMDRTGIGLVVTPTFRHVGPQAAAARLAGQFDNDRRGNQRLIRVAVLCRDNRERREVAPRRPVVGIRRQTRCQRLMRN